MQRAIQIIVVGCLLATLAQAQSQGIRSTSRAITGHRVALVIGNKEYKDVPLRSPVYDAQDMAKTLTALGFEVIQVENLSFEKMERAIRAFGAKIRKGGVALFYYSGHGAQVNGLNYLIPLGADIQHENDVKYKAVEAGFVIDQMQRAGAGFNIVILDACRNNPFLRSFRAAERGLAPIIAPKGSWIAYATAPGSVANDGAGRNSPYTRELLRNIQEPCVKIEDVFKRVRVAVTKITAEKQEPWETSSLRGDFFFNPNCNSPSPVEIGPDSLPLTKVQPASEPARGLEILERTIRAPASVRSLAYSPDGKFLSALCSNGELILWDAEGKEIWTRPRPGKDALTIAFTPDAKTLMSAYNEEIVFWDTQNGLVQRVLKIPKSTSVVFSHDRTLFATLQVNSGFIILWDVKTGEQLYRIAHPKEGIISIAFSNDDKVLVSANRNKTITCWKLATIAAYFIEPVPQDLIGQIAISPFDNWTIAVSGTNKKVFQINNGSKYTPESDLQGIDNEILTLLFSPNGDSLGGTDVNGQVYLWFKSQTPTYKLQHLSKDATSNTSELFTFKPILVISKEANFYKSRRPNVILAFSPDSRTLVTGGDNGEIKMWDLRNLY